MPIHTSFNPNGRQELKYGITYIDYMFLKNRLKYVMRLDTHSGSTGKYLIRSCYFDNFENKVMNEKKEGYLTRDKYRVRIYGKSDGVINLERKSKRNNLTYKSKCNMTRSEFEKIRIGDIQWMEKDDRSLICDLYLEMKGNLIKPMAVVDYDSTGVTEEGSSTMGSGMRGNMQGRGGFGRSQGQQPETTEDATNE